MKVLVSDKLAEAGVKKLKDAGISVDVKTGLPEDEIIKIIPEYDALIVRSETKVTPKIIEAGKNLKVIARAGVGVDNIDLPTATARGIMVVNSPEGNTIAAAEHSFALLLSLSRMIPQAYVSLINGNWDRAKFKGVEVFGKTLGVVGLGKIGKHVAKMGLGAGMTVIASDPFVSEEQAKTVGVELKSLDEVLAGSDYISLHIPKSKENMNLINKDTIAKMKKGVRIINAARGGIINEADLLAAIDEGKVAGAAIDVYLPEPPPMDSPILKHAKVVVTPHLGASTVEAQVNVAVDVVEQIIDIFNGKDARSAVNIPSMKPAMLAPIKEYIPLAEKLGKIASQLVDGAIEEVKVTYMGEVAKHEVYPLSTVVLKGILEKAMQETVNLVNASLKAKERGIKITESKSEETQDFNNVIVVKVKSKAGSRSVGGSLFGSFGQRLISIDDYKVDALPEGYLLILQNIDKPGMIGKIGTVLGKNKINIAGMDVGRVKADEKAVMVINVDTEVPEKLLKEIEKTEGISSAKMVSL